MLDRSLPPKQKQAFILASFENFRSVGRVPKIVNSSRNGQELKSRPPTEPLIVNFLILPKLRVKIVLSY